MSRQPRSDAREVRRLVSRRGPGPGLGLERPGTAFVDDGRGAPVDAAAACAAPALGLMAAPTGAAWSPELPGTSLEVILELEGRWEVEIDGAASTAGAFSGGLVAGPVRSRPVGPVRLVQLSVDPLAAPAVFGVPAGALPDLVELSALPGVAAAELLDRIDAADGVRGAPFGPGAVAVAQAWIQGRVRAAADAGDDGVPPDVRRARDLIRASGGALRVDAVARELGCSRRHLARRFAEFLGVSPSAYARLVRFERAARGLRTDPTRPLGALAADAGYADHAHMVRDFHALAGATPSAVAARLAR